MNILNEHYRQLLNNWNFSKENRLVFEGETTDVPVEIPDMKKKPAEAVPTSDEAPKVADKKVGQAKKEGNDVVKADKASTDKLADGGPKTAEVEKGSKEAVEAAKKAKEDAERGNLFKNKTAFKSLVNQLNEMPEMTDIKLDPENDDMAKMAKLILSKVDITRLKAALKGKLEPTEKERAEMKKAVLKNIGKLIDKSEVAEKKEISALSDWADELGLSFLEDSEPLKNLIALRFKVEKGGDDKTLLINGTEKVTSKEQLMALVTTRNPELGQKLTAYTEAADQGADNADDLLKEIEKHAGDEVKTHEAMKKLVEAFSDPEKAGKMGLLEGLGALLQLWGAIKAAMDSSDWQTLNEMFSDFNKGENPAKSMEKSKDQYKDVLATKEPKPSPRQLIKAYLTPRGKEADALFTEGLPEDETEEGEKKFNKEALSKYRMEAKPAIQTYLTDHLAVNSIDSITKLPNGFIDITAYDTNSGDKISIEIKLGAKISARKILYEPKASKKEGEEPTMVKAKGKVAWTEDIKSLKDLDNRVIKGEIAPVKPAVAGKPEDKPKDKPEDKPEDKPKTVLYKEDELDTKAKRSAILRDAKQLGKNTDFAKAWLIAKAQTNKGKDWSVKFEKDWIKKNLKKTSTGIALAEESTETKAEVPYKDSDLDTSGGRLAVVRAAGKFDDFNTAYKLKDPGNAAKWEKDWIKKNIPQTAEPAVAEADIKKTAEVKPKVDVKPKKKDETIATTEPEYSEKEQSGFKLRTTAEAQKLIDQYKLEFKGREGTMEFPKSSIGSIDFNSADAAKKTTKVDVNVVDGLLTFNVYEGDKVVDKIQYHADGTLKVNDRIIKPEAEPPVKSETVATKATAQEFLDRFKKNNPLKDTGLDSEDNLTLLASMLVKENYNKNTIIRIETKEDKKDGINYVTINLNSKYHNKGSTPKTVDNSMQKAFEKALPKDKDTA